MACRVAVRRRSPEEIQAQRNDYPNAADHGTTAVIEVFNTETSQWSIRVGINGSGSPPAGVLRAGEEFLQAEGHTQEV